MRISKIKKLCAGAVTGVVMCGVVNAEESKPNDQSLLIEAITVVTSKVDAQTIGGSVSFLDTEYLQQNNYGDIHRILARIPGVQVQDEDGFGLRPNIGLRGTGLDRSSKITVMEDGVLMAPAPYASPSAYYFPPLNIWNHPHQNALPYIKNTQNTNHSITIPLWGPFSIIIFKTATNY